MLVLLRPIGGLVIFDNEHGVVNYVKSSCALGQSRFVLGVFREWHSKLLWLIEFSEIILRSRTQS